MGAALPAPGARTTTSCEGQTCPSYRESAAGLSEDKVVTVICPKCKAENDLPDTLDRKIRYRCNVCKKRLANISNTNFGMVAAFALIAWWAIPVLVWVSVISARGASEYSDELALAYWGFQVSLVIGVTAMAMTVYFLQVGLRHRKSTGASPRGFRCFVLVSVLGACTCFAASGLAFAWWKWW